MLARAVDRNQSVHSSKPITLSQQLFPSSSPDSSQATLKNASQFSYPSNTRSTITGMGSVLQPSPSSIFNGLNGPRQNGGISGRKRPTGQADGLVYALNKRDSFRENTRGSTHDVADSSVDTNGLRKLQDAVYFDENDFEDDADLHFDVEEPLPKGNIAYPALPASIPAPENIEKTKANGAPNSSAPFEWSSSPLHHKMTPPTATTNHRTRNNILQGSPGSHNILDPNPRPTKRRTIPWLDNEKDKSGTLQSRQKHPSSGKTEFETPSRFEIDYTPLPKDAPRESLHPWNKTFSAVKEERKQLKQTNKRPIKFNDSKDEGSISSSRRSKGHKVARVFLSDEQQRVIDLVVKGKKSVFFTGSAGTGKSVLMREIIAALRGAYVREPDRLAVTASTGLAACNIGGVTLHSFGGIGLGKESVPELVKKIKRNQKAKMRWMRTKTLIVDEISMVDGEMFDKLENIARIIKNNGRPFGGIQLVITGDFFQLPPVPDYGKVAKFAFDAATWNTSIEHTIGLTQIFRQKDPDFANMLNEMRLGKLTQDSINTFKNLSRPIESSYGLEATELFPTRGEVDRANTLKMNNLTGEGKTFNAFDGGSIQDPTQRDKLLANCMAPSTLELKVGAQVMLIKNMDETLVNGSLGRVIDFMDEATYEVWFDEGDEGLRDLEACGSDDDAVKRSRKKLKTMVSKNIASTGQKYPRVEFALADGTTRTILVQRESWKIELPNGEVQASRSQIPLILAWALSIHKAQGQTLECVKVDLGRVFEKGQAYVALSRATCQKGLQVLRFDPKKVMAHDKVRSFYDSLYSIDQAAKMPLHRKRSAKNYEKEYMAANMDAFDDEEAIALAAGF